LLQFVDGNGAAMRRPHVEDAPFVHRHDPGRVPGRVEPRTPDRRDKGQRRDRREDPAEALHDGPRPRGDPQAERDDPDGDQRFAPSAEDAKGIFAKEFSHLHAPFRPE
jgi:hypothetical protein